MNAQVQVIRSEIERQREFIKSLFVEGDNSFYDGQDDAWSHILSFIETLENRGNFPKSNTNSQKGIVYQAINEIMGGHTPEKLAECNQTIFKVAMRALEIQQEEHLLPKGIDEAAVEYADTAIKQPKEYAIAAKADWLNGYDEGFKAGAKWQAEQNDKDLSEKIAAAYQLGLSNKEEQMMKDLPKWFVSNAPRSNLPTMFLTDRGIVLYNNGFEIPISDLEKLPKED